jgi:sodium-dependent dicarboxylate transporter 2/3/5
LCFGEVLAGGLCVLTALGWILREPRSLGGVTFGLSLIWPNISDGTIAIAGALALFAIPVSVRPVRFALDWERGGKIPWDIILLFGGGLSLADGIARSGLDKRLVQELHGLTAIPHWAILAVVCGLCVALSEIASNTAAAALLMPLTGSIAVALGESPLFLMLPVAFATSLGFMLPVATPPNALALASGRVTVVQMAWAGLILNGVGLAFIIAALYWLGFPALGVTPMSTTQLPISLPLKN